MAALSRREEAALLVGTVTPAAEPARAPVAAVGARAAVPMEAVEVEAEALVAAPTEAAEAPVAVQAAAAPRAVAAAVVAAIASSINSLQMASACDRVKSLILTL
jgi:hypothetical protein